MDALEHLLRTTPSRDAVPSLGAWLARMTTDCPFNVPFDRALWGGFEADRLGYAFVAGYQAALARLVLSAGVGGSLSARVSLAATEAGGAHPRAIATRLEETDGATVTIDGEKSFATLASIAEELLVVASRGEGPDGRNRLCLVRVPVGAAGLTIEDRPPTAFAPEVPHARVKLARVVVPRNAVLPGDGYEVYLKPFRTIEDTYVLAAALGHVIRCARAFDFDRGVIEGASTLACALERLADNAPGDPVGHLALAGLVRSLRRLVADFDGEWDKADAETRDRWRRDLGLFVVADGARELRTAAAWTRLAATRDSQRQLLGGAAAGAAGTVNS